MSIAMVPERELGAEEGSVSQEQVRRVAELANLELTPEEETLMQRDLNAILAHVAELNQLDTADVPPMAQVGELIQAIEEGAGGRLRPDEVRPSIERKAVMACAPESDGRFFKVPKVIER